MITVELLGTNYNFIFKHVKFSKSVRLGVSLEFSITYKIYLANGKGIVDLY